MKTAFYPKLAVDGIKKNKKMYIPYIITCVFSVAMFYIMRYLCLSKIIKQIPKTQTIVEVVTLGSYVIAIFSLIFLFYTNAFLIKTRKKEFGLLNVLGMDKKGIGKILVVETLIVAFVSIMMGVLFGIAFSKLCELILLKLVNADISFTLYISFDAILQTVLLFLIVFAIIFLNDIRHIRFSSPLNLVKSTNYGEKPPKANYLLGFLGFVLIGIAYYWAVTVESPVDALIWFFGAVVLVIIGTYLCLISGSVMLCKLLQKNKKYYYKKNNFVSVSSMSFRMKRNGAGLASICVLLTMVLVMISSTSCLHFGAEDSLKSRYPRDIAIKVNSEDISDLSEKDTEIYQKAIAKICKENEIDTKNVWDYREANISGLIDEKGNVIIDPAVATSVDYSKLITIHIIPISDYMKMTGETVKLGDNEAIASATLNFEIPENITLGKKTLKIVKEAEIIGIDTDSTNEVFPNVMVFVNDEKGVAESINKKIGNDGDYALSCSWNYGFDTSADIKTQEKATGEIADAIHKIMNGKENFSYRIDCLASERNDFKGTYGGFLFLGIMLSVLFLVVAVVIIYYKQISEGFEDANRFDIMMKVGMTKKDIKKSINSQMLLVFFLPIGLAVLHLGFAFPLIRKLLLLFGLNNLLLLITTTGVSVLLFAVFYFIVYKLTSNIYFEIVSGKR